jgi:hypothetical protein
MATGPADCVSTVGHRIGEFNVDIDVLIIRPMESQYLRYQPMEVRMVFRHNRGRTNYSGHLGMSSYSR